MDQANEIRQLQEEMAELRRQLLTLKTAGESEPKVQSTESLMAFGYQPLRFAILQKWMAKLPHPRQLKKYIDPGFIEQRQRGIRNLALELLKNMPAIKVARIVRKAPHKLELDSAVRFKRLDLQSLLNQQRQFIEQYLRDEGNSLRDEFGKTRYQIGRLRTIIENKRHKK